MNFPLIPRRLALAVFVLTVGLIPEPAGACVCECPDAQSVAEQFEAASAVVVAEVLGRQSVESVDEDGMRWIDSCGQQAIRLRILSSFKGTASGEVLALQSDAGTACDLDFNLRVGKRYVLFLRSDLEIDGCGSSAPFRRSSRLREELDALAAAR
jgi:hypothetical protein